MNAVRVPDFALVAPPRRAHRQAGMSIVEVLIASMLLLFIVLGTIPMFTMAATSNLSGQDSTKAANYARERLEQLWQLPLSHDTLTVLAGTDRAWTEYLDETTKQWALLMGPTPPAGTLWTRRTVIRQFNVANLATPISAAEAADDPTLVQIKEVTVAVRLSSGATFGGGKAFTIRAYKSQ